MKINGVSGTNTQMGQMGMNQATDSYSLLKQWVRKRRQYRQQLMPMLMSVYKGGMSYVRN